jgi:hypothetical protein
VTGHSPTAVWSSRGSLHASRLGLPWTSPATLGPHQGFIGTHAVAASAGGTALALFTNADASSLQSARFSGGAWSAPSSLGEPGEAPALASDGGGNMLAVWVGNNVVRGARFDVAAGFWTIEPLGPMAEGITSLRIAANHDGTAVAAWCERRNVRSFIRANLFGLGGGWGGATDMGSVPTCTPDVSVEMIEYSRLAVVDAGINDLGLASVLWTDGGIKLRRFVPAPGVGWTPVETLASGADAIQVRMAVSNGGIIAAWLTTIARRPGIVQARVYSPATGSWSPTATVAPASSHYRYPHLAAGVDDRGRGMLAFLHEGYATTSRWDGTGFGALARHGDFGSYEVDMAMDPNGWAFLIWIWGNQRVWLANYSPE